MTALRAGLVGLGMMGRHYVDLVRPTRAGPVAGVVREPLQQSLAHVFEYPGLVEEVAARGLAEAVHAAPGPPLVTATGVMATPVPAALLAWGRTHDGQWMAGIAFLFHRWSRRALVTVWMPASAVQPHAGLHYGDVPRVLLPDQPDDWPELPPRYPQAGPDWTASHLHVPRPNPAGSY